MPLSVKPGWVRVAVCGAHMSGLPLNHQLLDLDGILLSGTHTSAEYRLFRLHGFTPARPGLLRTMDGSGGSIEVEVWELPIENYGKFVAGIPSPLGIGTLTLADGSTVQGFLCEAYATQGALDITPIGSWREYLNRQGQRIIDENAPS